MDDRDDSPGPEVCEGVDDGWEDAATKVARWRAVKARIEAAFPVPRDAVEAAIRDAWELGHVEARIDAAGFPPEMVYEIPDGILTLPDPED